MPRCSVVRWRLPDWRLSFKSLTALALACALLLAGHARAETPVFSDAERAAASLHGSWPPKPAADPSNRLSGDASAIALGHALFSDVRLSANAQISCASCHAPDDAFVDGAVTGRGLEALERNTSTLMNLAFSRWFGWGGESDSLWMQSLRPLMSAAEMDGASTAPGVVRGDPELSAALSLLSRKPVSELSDEALLVNVAKALAAYQETLITEATDFDSFVAALEARDPIAMARYPQDAQRGLQIFIGKGRCSACHFGPAFSNGEFAEIGIPYFTAQGVDRGRHSGIRSVKTSPYNLLGDYADFPDDDDEARRAQDKTRLVRERPDSFGQFRVPGLRSIRHTAPYMHNGSLATLRDVVMHYSEIDTERLHMRGTGLLRPLKLGAREINDLVAFLNTL